MGLPVWNGRHHGFRAAIYSGFTSEHPGPLRFTKADTAAVRTSPVHPSTLSERLYATITDA